MVSVSIRQWSNCFHMSVWFWNRVICIFMGPIMTDVFSCRSTSFFELAMCDKGNIHWMTPTHTRYHVCVDALDVSCVLHWAIQSPPALSVILPSLSWTRGRKGQTSEHRKSKEAANRYWCYWFKRFTSLHHYSFQGLLNVSYDAVLHLQRGRKTHARMRI